MPPSYKPALDSDIQAQEKGQSFLDAVYFFRCAWRVIAISTSLGLLVALTYIALTPKQYEAVAQISMAQIVTKDSGLGKNVEDVNLLIARMNLPSSYSMTQVIACGLENERNPLEILSKKIKWTTPKAVLNVVQIKLSANSPKVAGACIAALVDLVSQSQKELTLPYITEAKLKLADDQSRLDIVRKLASQADRSGAAVAAVYLSTRDEIRYLLDEMGELRNLIDSEGSRGTRLIAPIYVNDTAISPKVGVVMFTGLLTGLFFGVLISIYRKYFAKLTLATFTGHSLEK